MLNWRDPKNPLSGGAERVTQGYLDALAARGHEVFWFANHFHDAPPVEKVGAIQIARGGGKGSSIMAARRWYRAQKPFDLVIDQHHGIPWLAPWWCRTNCAAYIHEVLGPIWSSFYPWPISAMGRWQERWTHWLYRKTPFWTASAYTQKFLHQHGVRDVTIIPYGVATVALPELPPKAITQPLQLVVVSRLAPNKRIDHAIEALDCLLRKGVPATLSIIGTGEEEAKLRSLAASKQLVDKITFTGALGEKEKDEQLRNSHLLLHTSVREGWGLNVIEANAMGTPTVVYPVPGLIESTLHRETGLVSRDETPASMTEAITGLLQAPDDYQRYRHAAWERAKTFHWNQVLPKACEWLEARARSKTRYIAA